MPNIAEGLKIKDKHLKDITGYGFSYDMYRNEYVYKRNEIGCTITVEGYIYCCDKFRYVLNKLKKVNIVEKIIWS